MNMIIFILPLTISAVLIFSFPLFQTIWRLIIDKNGINYLEMFSMILFSCGMLFLMKPELILPNELLLI